MDVSAVIMAAGASRRMGQPKQLLAVDGQPMILHVVNAAVAAGLAQVIVVLGANASKIMPLLSSEPATIVINSDWREGMASSLRCGLALVAPRSSAALFIPADMPKLSSGVLRAIVDHFQASRSSIIVPTCEGRRGNPVLMSRPFFPELMGLRGDMGGRVILASHPGDVTELELHDDSILFDVDTPADYATSSH